MSSFFCIFAPRFESALFVHTNPLKRMKKLVFALLFLVSCLVANAQGGGVPVDGIIAVIGKEIIMQSDLEKHYLDYASQFKTVEDPFETRCYILETLVFNKLMVNQADLDSIEVSDEEVDYRINTRIAYFLQQVGGDEKYIENYFHKSMSQIKKEMRELMYEQALIEQVQYKLTGNITITPSEVKQFAANISADSMPLVPTTYQFGEIVKIPPELNNGLSDSEKTAFDDMVLFFLTEWHAEDRSGRYGVTVELTDETQCRKTVEDFVGYFCETYLAKK